MNGRIIWETLGSVVLKGNPLGDPRLREVPVYLPASYLRDRTRRYPVVYYLPAFTGTPRGAVESHPWKESLVERLDRLIAEGGAPECLLVVPDCFTAYGGSQYRDSRATGAYETHVVSELVPYVDAKYRTVAAPGARAVMGKSSGGYGALWLGMRHPGVFGHVLCHSGDMGFEACYGPDILKCVNALARWGGSFARFLREFRSAREKSGFPHELVNMAGMASSYSPNPRGALGFDLPFDEATGELVERVWKRWLACDPVRLAEAHAGSLRALKTLFFDCGTSDEFHLHLGARRLARELKRLKVPHVHEEHDGGHFELGRRFERSFEVLKKALA